jgi:hypothetical protein
MHSAKLVLPAPAWPSKTIFFTCDVSKSAMANYFKFEIIQPLKI